MKTTAEKAIVAYAEARSAVDDAIAGQKERAAANQPFYGRVAREHGPLLEAMKLLLEGRDPEVAGSEIIRVSESLRRHQEATYTSISSFPKSVRQQCYLDGLAAIAIVGGQNMGRGLPDRVM